MNAFAVEIGKNNNFKYIGSITEEEYSVLYNIFECYKSETGIHIDLYKKNIIRNANLSTFLSCFEKKSIKKNTVVEKYKNLFEFIKEAGYDMILYGN